MPSVTLSRHFEPPVPRLPFVATAGGGIPLTHPVRSSGGVFSYWQLTPAKRHRRRSQAQEAVLSYHDLRSTADIEQRLSYHPASSPERQA